MPLRRLATAVCLGLTLVLASPLTGSAGATPTASPAPVATGLTYAASATNVYVERPVTITGRVAVTAGTGRYATVQVRQPTGQWGNHQSIKTTTSGAFVFALPTAAKGSRAWRVHVPASSDLPAETGPSLTVTVIAKPVPGAATYTLLYPADNGTWSRWNPCQSVDYRVNPGTTKKSVASGRIADTRAAATRLSQATGITFRYKGTTRAVPGKARSTPEAGTEMVIAWANPGVSTWMPKPKKGRPAYAGLGGATGLISSYNTAGMRVDQIVTAGVILDATLPLAGGFGSGPRYGWQGTRGQLLMHEMAHASGLGHTSAKSEIMYGTLQRRSAAWGKGDLTGLRLLGRSQGCLAQARPATR